LSRLVRLARDKRPPDSASQASIDSRRGRYNLASRRRDGASIGQRWHDGAWWFSRQVSRLASIRLEGAGIREKALNANHST